MFSADAVITITPSMTFFIISVINRDCLGKILLAPVVVTAVLSPEASDHLFRQVKSPHRKIKGIFNHPIILINQNNPPIIRIRNRLHLRVNRNGSLKLRLHIPCTGHLIAKNLTLALKFNTPGVQLSLPKGTQKNLALNQQRHCSKDKHQHNQNDLHAESIGAQPLHPSKPFHLL